MSRERMTMKTASNLALPKHCNMDDRVAVQYLVEEILSRDACISVNDGEETALSLSDSYEEVIESLTSTGEDYLIASNSDGAQLGWFYLIYNNGSDGDPLIVISDYLSTAFCQEVYDRVAERLGAP